MIELPIYLESDKKSAIIKKSQYVSENLIALEKSYYTDIDSPVTNIFYKDGHETSTPLDLEVTMEIFSIEISGNWVGIETESEDNSRKKYLVFDRRYISSVVEIYLDDNEDIPAIEIFIGIHSFISRLGIKEFIKSIS